MRMEKTEMEFVAFDVQDVILTSDVLTINGYFDGIQNNLTFNYGGQNYTDMGKLRASFDQSGKSYTSVFSYIDGAGQKEDDTFVNALNDDKSDSNLSSIYKTGNGSYTYDFSVSKWIHDYKQ